MAPFSDALSGRLQQEIHHRRLPDEFMQAVQRWYLPLAQALAERKKQGQTALISLNGAQGTGKSTLTAFLRLLLNEHFQQYTVEISIDDFYLTRAERLQLSQQLHPLLKTRGVPGTHDIALAEQTLDGLQACSADHVIDLPQFDKAQDDRKPRSQWLKINRPVDIILFEGWCNNAPVQSAEQLQQPVNELERQEDAEGIWRNYVNEQLKIYHQKLFQRADVLVFLQAPSFEKVYEWRGLQEQKLREQANANQSAVMDEQQLRRFIQHYERITRSCLEVLPGVADIVLSLGDDHQIESMKRRDQEEAGRP